MNWTQMQNWFFDKILKEKKEARPRSKPPIKNSKEKKGYNYPQREITRIDYQDAFFDASRSMIRFKKPWRLIRMIGKIINENIEVSHSAFLICDNDGKSYVLVNNKGVHGRRTSTDYVRVGSRRPLIELFRRRKNSYIFENGAVSFKELKWILESGKLLRKDVYCHNRLRLAVKEMELLNAEFCVPCFFKKELLGLLILGKKISSRNFTREDINLLTTLANDVAIALANARLIEKLRKKMDEVEYLYNKEHQLFINIAVTLTKAIDARDIYTYGHTERVTRYCLAITDELDEILDIGINSRFKDMLQMTALLHDIGKIGIPDRILNKKGKLNVDERKIVEKHPKIGASILFPIPEMNEVAKCIRSHQEWHNGNGYPDGLRKDEIPLMSRIVSVADAFDAITSNRPYRKKKSVKESLEEIKKCSGMQFDPKVVEAFLNAYEKGKIK
jgi:hypothetical protein